MIAWSFHRAAPRAEVMPNSPEPGADNGFARNGGGPTFDEALARRIEEASLNAWPSLHQLVLDGWLIRFAGGFTKRANSVVPLYGAHDASDAKIAYCERLYARQRLRTIFRLTTLDDHGALERALDVRGYRPIEPTRVMARPLEARDAYPGPSALRARTRAHWIRTYAALTDMPAQSQSLHNALLKNICLPCVYFTLEEDGVDVACALGVIDEPLLGIFDVVTDPRRRGLGHGERLLRALLAEGAHRGARHAYLQVLDENAPAERLYTRLGFRSLYGYRYRVAP
jgi:N-acetylglutamate synthase